MSSSPARAVSISTGTSLRSRIRSSVCQPSSSGIATSSTTRSGASASSRLERLEPVGRLDDRVAGALEQHPHEAAYVVLVLHDEHLSRLHLSCIPDRRRHVVALSARANPRGPYASRAASARAPMCAIAWIEICGLTPEAVGKAEPSST